MCSTPVILGEGFYYVYARQASGIRRLRSAAVTIKRMSQTGPATVPEWQDFLRSYSDDYLRVSTEEYLAYLEDAQRENRWLGYEPASEDAVRAAEERLGVRLPPSYRNFLLTSNGWRNIAPLLGELRKVDEIALLPEAEPFLVEAWSGEVDLALEQCLLVTGPANGDLWLLDRSDIGPDGEWAAYYWCPGDGEGPEPYPGFSALVVEGRDEFEEDSGMEGRPVHPDGADALVAEGRRQAQAGDVEAALTALDAAHVKGSELAPYLAGLLKCFTEPGSLAENHIRNNVFQERILKSVDETHLRAELIPLYLNMGQDGAPAHPGYFASWVADYLPPADAAETDGMAELEVLAARAARYVRPTLPETPAFQQALDWARELIAVDDHDAAWTVIEQALPLWEPNSPYRIAPVILRVDPVFHPVVTPDRYRTIVTTAR
jgi:hypothetical protein